jgi:glycosyltransferase involved in cell wall biosynthesis
MKIAIFHSFMDNIGGAEKVSLILARELNADIYTTNINKDKISKLGFSDVIPRIKSIGKVPVQAPFKHQLTLWKFRKLNLKNKYDRYIICGDWAMSACVNNHPNIWYVHSPLNELWQWKDFVKYQILNFWKRPIFDAWVWFNRGLTRKYSKKIDFWFCNSQNTKNRIKKYYEKEAEINYPPTYSKDYYHSEHKNYWLSVNRILKHKRIEMQIDAFKELPNEKLIIVGSYEKNATQFESYKKQIEDNKPDNVEIKHWVDDQELKKLYAECKGFITTSRDEDFGMNVVEAMASGKSVIAPAEGGYLESVLDNETGILIKDIDSAKIKNAILNIDQKIKNSLNFYKENSIKRSNKFDTEIFINKFKQALE